MKLTTLILLISLIQVSAATFGQRITLNKKNISIGKVFSEIQKQTGLDVFISNDVLNADKTINISFNNTDLKEVLPFIIGSQNTYLIEQNLIVIKKREKNLIDKISEIFYSFEVRGKVVDEIGNPVSGVVVRSKDGKQAALTSTDGSFYLKDVEEGTVLVFTFIGYNIKELKASKDMGNISLKLADNKLDEVQVIGYGEISQRFSTGNVSSITSAQIENKPIQNVLLALQGEVPGIVVRQATGYANSGINIQLQGMNSLGRSNDALYVVDGVPMDSQLPNQQNKVGGISNSGNGNGSYGSNAGNPLNFVNPEDIASVSVLKGPDATAIYGSRGANGVILITTKKGKPGEARVDIGGQEGFSEYPSFLKLMDRNEYLQLRRDSYYGTDGLTNYSPEFATQYDLNGLWDTNRYTDWQKKLVGNTARYSTYSAALSGGTTLDQYRLSANYNRQTTVLDRSDLNDQKFSFNSSLNHASSNGKFKAGFNAIYQYDNNRLPAADLSGIASTLSPVAPELYNSDGTLNWALDTNGNPSWTNPLAVLEKITYTKTASLVANLNLSYKLVKGLQLSSSFSYNNLQIKELQATTSSVYSPLDLANGATPYSAFNRASTGNWIIEPQLSYSGILAKGKIDILLGSTFQGKNMEQLRTYGFDYASDVQLEDPGAAGDYFVADRSMSNYRYNAGFARLNYNLNNKYLLNLSFRRDGSSRFGSNNQFHSFYGLGTGWIFSEEKFLKNKLPWLSFGKIKASYGTTGNDGIGDYGYLNLYKTSSYPVNYQQSAILVSDGIPNPNLQWEEVRKMDYGLELGFLNNRIVINSYYYHNICSNQLLNYALPATTGGNSYRRNFPAKFKNDGWEFSLTTINLQNRIFSWRTNLNLSTVRNKLVDFPDLATSAYASTFTIGQSVGAQKFYDFAGINPSTGLYQFRKSDGTLTSDPNSLNLARDGVSVDFLTRMSGGISNILKYGNIELSFLFDFVLRNGQNYAGLNPGVFNSFENKGNQPAYLLDYWRQSGDNSTYQRPSSVFGNVTTIGGVGYALNSTFVFKDASYVKLRNVNLSYKIPKKWLKSIYFKDANVFINAHNLFSIDGYKGIDPESVSGLYLSLPPLRTISLGARIGL